MRVQYDRLLEYAWCPIEGSHLPQFNGESLAVSIAEPAFLPAQPAVQNRAHDGAGLVNLRIEQPIKNLPAVTSGTPQSPRARAASCVWRDLLLRHPDR